MTEALRDAWDMPRIAVFLAVVEQGTFSGAARHLSLSKSVVSTHIKRLEAICGARLFQRSTRKVSLTQAGETLLPHARRLGQAWSDGLEAVEAQGSEPRGTLVITAPSLLQDMLLNQVLSRYLAQYPHMTVTVRVTDEVLDVIDQRIDIALRTGPLVDSDLVARYLGKSRVIVVASPELAAGRDLPEHPRALAGWPFLRHVGMPRARVFYGPEDERFAFEPEAQVTVDLASGMPKLLAAGVGVAVLPEQTLRHELGTGSLVRLLPEWVSEAMSYFAVFPSKEHQTPRVSRFMDLLFEHVEQLC